jgi:hypothetical protein
MARTVERDVVDRAGHPARLHRAVERAGQSVLLMCMTPGLLVVKPLRVLRRQRGGASRRSRPSSATVEFGGLASRSVMMLT